jgi:hypothetical protein
MLKDIDDFKIDTDKLHTTPMGEERIRRNLGLKTEDVLAWCKTAAANAPESAIIRRGKNFYVTCNGFTLTVNAHSHTIITAHKDKNQE